MNYSGHDDAWREWHEALGSARMPHGWILAGIAGLGKGAFARAAAARLVAEPGVAQPAPAVHPDIIVLEALPATDADEAKRAEGKPYQTKRNISVDQIRRMQSRLTTRPTLGDRRAIVIDTADELEKGAVNALLKSLEEPPSGTFFLLVSHRLGRLLPTVRSRCRILRFAPLASIEVARILANEAPQASAETRNAAVAAADGSPGAASSFVAQDLGGVHAAMLKIVAQGDDGFGLRGALAEEFGTRPDRDRLQAVCDLARAVLATALDHAAPLHQQRIIAAHAALVRLGGQLPSYNFDAGLAAMEIGGLLASAALPRETVY